MRTQEIEKAPSRSKQEAPMTRELVNDYCTIGGSQVKARPAVGWEAIKPKQSNKPEYLRQAQAAVQKAWLGYLWLIDTLESANKWDQGSVEDAWDTYYQAKRQCEEAWDAAEQGFDSLPIPF